MFTWLFQSYWRDEAFSVLLAQKPFSEILRLVAYDFSPPLYFFVLRIWIIVFGSSESATRSLSVLFYGLTLITIALVLKRFSSMKPWLIISTVLLLGLVHPVLTANAFETRMYTMIAWLVTLSWYLLLCKKWRLYALVVVAGLYTHYFMMIMFSVQLIYLLALWWPGHRKIFHVAKQNVHTILLLCVPLILFIPWTLLFLISHNFGQSHSFWIPKPSLRDLMSIPSFITLGHDTFSNFKFDVLPFSLLMYALVVLSFLQKKKSRGHIVYPLLIWTFLPAIIVWIFSQFTTSLYLPRYLIVSSPALIILIIVCLNELQTISKIIITTLVSLLLWNFISTGTQFSTTRQLFSPTKENLRSKIQQIKKIAKSTDYLIVESELDYHVAQVYWFKEENVKIIGKTYAEIPDFVGKSLIPESAILTKPYPKLEGFIFKQDRKVNKFTQ